MTKGQDAPGTKRGWAAATLAIGIALGVCEGDAQAEVLASNLGQTASNHDIPDNYDEVYQNVTTGNHALGYKITSVEVHGNELQFGIVFPPNPVHLLIMLAEDVGSFTNEDVQTLTGASNAGCDDDGDNCTGVRFLPAGGSTVTVDANAEYAFVVSGTSELDGLVMSTTTSDNEDSGSWSMANKFNYITTGFPGSTGEVDRALRMEIRGEKRGSKEARLESLTLRDGEGNSLTLDPTFSSDTESYSIEVPFGVSRITIEAGTKHDGATTALPADDDGGTQGTQVDLDVGSNTISVKVTAENDTATKTYTVTVERDAGDDATLKSLSFETLDGGRVLLGSPFSPSETSYFGEVPHADDQVTVAAETTDEDASLALPNDANAEAQGIQVALDVGDNDIPITVTGANGTATMTYTMTVRRLAANVAATGAPVIEGSFRVGETLTVNRGTVADENGLQEGGFHYRWIRIEGTAETAISAAQGTTYTLTEADKGSRIKVVATFRDLVGYQEQRSSETHPARGTISRAKPPPCTTSQADETWCANMTVGSWHTEVNGSWAHGEYSETVVETSERERGYRRDRCAGRLAVSDPHLVDERTAGDTCYGEMSDDDFTVSGTTYTIKGLYHFTQYAWLRLDFTSTVNLTKLNGLSFVVDGTEYRMADRRRPGTARASRVEWPARLTGNMGWTVPGTVRVTLKTASSMQEAHDPPEVSGSPAVARPGSDGEWNAGDTVEVTLTFSEAVDVNTGGGVPSIGIALGGTEARTAAYTSGSGTTKLVFEHELAKTEGDHGIMGVTPNSLALNGGTIRSGTTGADAVLTHAGALVQGAAIRDSPKPVVSIEAPTTTPVAEGTPLVFTLRRTEPTAAALSVNISVTETGDALAAPRPTTVAFAAGAAETPLRIPTVDDETVEDASRLTVTLSAGSGYTVDSSARNAEGVVESDDIEPMTARWTELPAEHDGSTPLWVRFAFSHEPDGYSYETVHKHLFDVAGGAIVKAKRAVKGSNLGWAMRIQPSGGGDVTLDAKATTGCAAARSACDRDGRKFDGALEATITGPPLLGVADATVHEEEGATLDFVVTLGRARSETTTVDYATSDGTARAGEDYTAVSGTLTFEARERSKTVPVSVHGDAHDEGPETLTLTLSNASGAWIDDATATGTIVNTDPVPKAWIARFGRTVAEQVLEAVEARMRAPRQREAVVSLGGERIGLGPLFGTGRDASAADGASRGDGDGEARSVRAAEEGEAEREAADLADWLKGAADTDGQPLDGTRTMEQRELLLGSSFSLTAGTADGGFVSMWGRGAVTHFDGREGALALDGEVTSAMLGTDWRRGRWTTGLVLAHSLGAGGYGGGEAGGGTISAALTGLYPWFSHALTDRLEAWGAAGYGAGSLTLEPGYGPAIRTDLDLWMAAAGLRGTIVGPGSVSPGSGPGAGGPGGGPFGRLTLTAKTDAMIAGTSTDAVSGSSPGGRLAEEEAEATRLRLGLEGALPVALGDGAVLTPGFELGVRHDGGDAETGFGADIGASLSWTDPKRGLSAKLLGRGLLVHEADGFRERGLSGAFSWDPVEGERGPRVSLTQTVGGASSGGAEALLGRTTMEGLAANDNLPGSGTGGDDLRSRRLDLALGYGFGVLDDRWTAIPELGLGLADTGRDQRLGWRLVERVSRGLAMELALEGTRHEQAGGGDPERGLAAGAGWRLTGPGAGSFELRLKAAMRGTANDAPAQHEAGLHVTARW